MKGVLKFESEGFISTMWDVKNADGYVSAFGWSGFISTMWDVKL